MLTDSTTTKYAVARRTTIISDGYDDVATAQRQLAHVEDTMRGVGLKPDVHVVEVEVVTTVGRAHAYVEPTTEDIEQAETETHVDVQAEGKTISEAGAAAADKVATAVKGGKPAKGDAA